MTFVNVGHLLCALVASTSLAGCRDSFSDSELTAEVRPVAALPIPETMTRTQTADAGVVIESASGHIVENVTLTWESSDARVVQVVPTEAGHRALLTATGLGQAEIIVRITDGIGAVPHTVLRDTVQVFEKWLSVAVGPSSVCAINVDSVPYCRGSPAGDGSRNFADTPVKVRGLLDFPAVHLELGRRTSCVTVFGGESVYCWGDNSGGEMGNGDVSPSLIAVKALQAADPDLLSLSGGGVFFCGTFGDELFGLVFGQCWGLDFLGQLGAEPPGPPRNCLFEKDRFPCSPEPAGDLLAGGVLLEPRLVSAGETHACAIGWDRLVYCWGAAAMGQVGPGEPGAPIQRCSPTPYQSRDPAGIPCLRTAVVVDQSIDFASVSAGWDIHTFEPPNFFYSHWQAESHTCGVGVNGQAYCWGKNDFGQLGAPSDSVCQRAFSDASPELPEVPAPCRAHPIPVLAPAAGTFKTVSAGSQHTCGIAADDRAYCWGSNEFGQLGDGTRGPGNFRMTPAPITGDHRFNSLDSGPIFTCGVTTAGLIYCWGTIPTKLEEPQ